MPHRFVFLDFVVEGTGDYLVLLFLGELDEVNGVAADSDGKLGILFGMCLCVKEGLTGENVDVQVVSALFNIAVKEGNKVIYLVFRCCHFYFSFLRMGILRKM